MKRNDKGFMLENKLGLQIFRSLQEKNLESWIGLFPTADEFKDVLEQMMAAHKDGLTQQGIDEMLMNRALEADSLYAVDFNELLRQAHQLAIDWQKAQYIKFDLLVAYPDKMKIKYLTGDIFFSCDRKIYEIKDIEALEIRKGYKLQGVKLIKESY